MPIGIIIGMIFMTGLTIALAITFFRGLSRLRILSRTTFDSISTITPGARVVVRGTVTTKNTHRAPISEEACAWFSSQAKAARATRNGKQFSTVEDLRSEAPLIVRDATGSISIDPHLAFVATPSTRYYWSSDEPLRFGAKKLVFGRSVPLYPKREGTLSAVDTASSAERFRAQALYEEHTVKKGDELICAGVAEHGPKGMTITRKRKSQGVIASVEHSPSRTELKSQVITYGIALGVIGTLVLNMVLITVIMLVSILLR